MKKKYIYKFTAILLLFVFMLLPCGLSETERVFAEDSNISVINNISDGKDNINNLIKSKALAFRVGFSDLPLSDDASDDSITADEVRAYFEGVSYAEKPYESISGFYERSSFGKLDIGLGEIIDVELTGTRESYYGNSGSEAEYRLINEIISRPEIAQRLSEYDSDGDGAAELVYFFCNGSSEDKGSIWWPHCHTENNDTFTAEGYALKDYVFTCKEPVNVLIHETGHLLGLPDYYSYEDYYTYDFSVPDIMNDNYADHNGFSKWLAGWIDDNDIVFVNKENTGKDGVEVTLAPIDSNNDGSKLIAVISPERTEQYGEFFLVEYISGSGNMSMYDNKRDYPKGFRVIHVYYDEINERLYANALTKDHSIGADFGVFGDGDEITPYTVPSSAFIKDGVPSEFTGISITDFNTSGAPKFRVSFSDEERKNTPIYFMQNDDIPSNMLELTLTSDRPLILKNQNGANNVRLEKDGASYPLILKADEYNATKFYLEYRRLKQPLLPDTSYTLVFPQDTFTNSENEIIDEIRQEIYTGSFTKIENIKCREIGNGYALRTGLVPYGSSCAYAVMTKMVVSDGIGFKFINFNSDDNDSGKEFFIELPEAPENITAIDAFASYDGNYIIYAKTDSNTYVKKVSSEGESRSELVCLPESVDIIELGDTLKGISTVSLNGDAKDVLSGSTGEFKGSIFTFNFEGDIKKVLYNYDAFIAGGFFALDDSKYCIAGYDDLNDIYYINIYDKNDSFVKRINYSKELPLAFCTDKDIVTSVEISFDEANEEHFIIKRNDLMGNDILKKRVDTDKLDEMYLSGVRLMPAKWGYLLYYRYSGRTDQALSKLLFLTKEFEQIGTVSLPGGADFLPQSDRAVVVWEDDEERSMAWTEVIFSNIEPDEYNEPSKEIKETVEFQASTVNNNENSLKEIKDTEKIIESENASSEVKAKNNAYASKAAATGVSDYLTVLIFICSIAGVGLTSTLIYFVFNRIRK